MLKLCCFKKGISQSNKIRSYDSTPSDSTGIQKEKSGYFDCIKSYKKIDSKNDNKGTLSLQIDTEENTDSLENQGIAQKNCCLATFYRCFPSLVSSKKGQDDIDFSGPDRSLMFDPNAFLTNQINLDKKEAGIQECQKYLKALDALNKFLKKLDINMHNNRDDANISRSIPRANSPTTWHLEQTLAQSNRIAYESIQNSMKASLQRLVNLELLKNDCLSLNSSDEKELVNSLLIKLHAFPDKNVI